MPRPRKRRFVDFAYHRGKGPRRFWPLENGSEEAFLPPSGQKAFAEVQLTLDELEAMRLSYLEKLTQNEGAARMEIHQSTFQRTLKRALEKVTDAFVYGKAIRIEGGDYRMPGRDGTGPYGEGPVGGRGGRGQGRGQGGKGRGGFGFGGPEGSCVCPACGCEIPHKPGVPCSQIKCEKCGTPLVRKT
ncbi:MAG: DUF134 domain-containing protein [Methanosarcinaceae archaeon]|nr:DUF134 domain-containing protein [Methanosarcinaceae archaeon]MDD4748770.1 DUF134 domain-containing protein [Methanosarcinaceae archaeon]